MGTSLGIIGGFDSWLRDTTGITAVFRGIDNAGQDRATFPTRLRPPGPNVSNRDKSRWHALCSHCCVSSAAMEAAVAIFNTFPAFPHGDGSPARLSGLSVLFRVMAAVGSAVDYGRASAAQTGLQRAVDAAACALVKDAALDPDAKLEQAGGEDHPDPGSSGDGRLPPQGHRHLAQCQDDPHRRLRPMQTASMAVAGFKAIPIGSEAEAAWGWSRIELASTTPAR